MSSTEEAPVVEMEGITKRFGRVTALDGVDFEVGENEIMGLVGDNGAGKSTLIKTLVGIHEPDEGEVRVRGSPVDIDSPGEAREYGIATVYQDLALVDELSVSANMYLGQSKTKKLGGVLPIIDWDGMNEEADRLLEERLQFDVPVENDVEFLSGGERQAVAIGRALLADPDIVILDEPTSALSADAVERVIRLVKSLREQGISVILISHNLDEIFSLTDRLTILRAGKKVATVDSEDVNSEQVVELMIAGQSATVDI